LIYRDSMPDGVDERAPVDRWRWAYPLAIALMLLPFAVAIVTTLLDGGHTPYADRALMELRIRDVGLHPVTIGLYSRDGWAHPGPFVYYLLAVPYRLLGTDMNALMVGSLLINAAAVATMGVIAKRVGGLGAALVVLVAASAVVRALGMELLVDPWVCWITVLPFGTFCLLTWALADGRIWALPVTAVVASFLAQTHVGYAPIALPGLAVGTVWLVVRIRRQHRDRMRALLGGALVTVGALVVIWAPPLWDEWRGTHNLSTIVRWFRDTKEAAHTLGEGARIVGGQFAIVPDWITGTRRISFDGSITLVHTTLVPLLLIPVVLAGLVAFRRRDRVARSLLVMLAVTVLAAIVSVARTSGQMYEYRLLWTWTLGALVTAAAAFALWRGLRPRVPASVRPVIIGVLVVTLLGLAVAQTADALDTDRPYTWDSPEVAQAVDRAATHLHRDGGQIVFSSESFVGNWYQQGVVLAFEHAGFDVRVPSDIAEVYGAHRVQRPGRVQARLLVLANTEIVDDTGRPGYHVIGFGAQRSLAATAREGERVRTLQRRLLDEQQAGRITVDELNKRAVLLPKAPNAVLILERNR
jgi:hypothetical protein